MPCPSGMQGWPLGTPGGQPASGYTLSLSFHPFPGPWPTPPFLYYKRYGLPSGLSHSGRPSGHVVVISVPLLLYLKHIGTGISCSISSVPGKSVSLGWWIFGGPILIFLKRWWDFHWTPGLLLRLRQSWSLSVELLLIPPLYKLENDLFPKSNQGHLNSNWDPRRELLFPPVSIYCLTLEASWWKWKRRVKKLA